LPAISTAEARGLYALEKFGFRHLSQFRLGPLRIAAARASRHVVPLAGIRAVPTIDLTDAELAAVTAAVLRTIEDDRFPHAPRLVPMRTALAKFDEATAAEADIRIETEMASKPAPEPKAPPPAKADKRTRR
jgi:hypothetical protein